MLIKCPSCGSDKYVKNGMKGGKRRYLCRNTGCKRATFQIESKKISYEKKLIALTLGQCSMHPQEDEVVKKRNIAKIIGCAVGSLYRWDKIEKKIIGEVVGKKIDWETKINFLLERSGINLSPTLKNSVLSKLNRFR